ncbi:MULTISPECIES: hypothetical protein [Nostoc]|uniref:Uncharacterized protein n=1 Tax=Nostoc punctiforme FACHB-252 TaxID=1357509 RepID=A0ABR8HKX7_NOSPU|nr:MULTISPECIES: hypothetical protein [Nostoc]MBC1237241.1 hypothetical protein [Nostoc sp. 2RC]MBD2615650.1 hypothetical protein [Nostoc punctiforme FACHB-252]
MNAEDFESDFVDFYVDFGYRADGILPDGINPASHLESEAGLDSLAAIAREHAVSCCYFVVLTWRTLTVGSYPCTEEEYQNQLVPETVITAATNYQPSENIWKN